MIQPEHLLIFGVIVIVVFAVYSIIAHANKNNPTF